MSWLTRRYFTARLILSSPKQQAQDKEAQVTCDECILPGLRIISRIAITFQKMHLIEGCCCSMLPDDVWPLTWMLLRVLLSVFHHNWHEWGQQWVTRGHQSEAGGQGADNTHKAAPVLLAVGVHSAISGLSPVSARSPVTGPPWAPVLGLGQQLLVRCPGEDRGWSARAWRECSHQPLVTIRHQNRVTGAHYTALSYCHTITQSPAHPSFGSWDRKAFKKTLLISL